MSCKEYIKNINNYDEKFNSDLTYYYLFNAKNANRSDCPPETVTNITTPVLYIPSKHLDSNMQKIYSTIYLEKDKVIENFKRGEICANKFPK